MNAILSDAILLPDLIPLVVHDLLHGQVSVLPQLDPLVSVAHTGVFYQSTEHL